MSKEISIERVLAVAQRACEIVGNSCLESEYSADDYLEACRILQDRGGREVVYQRKIHGFKCQECGQITGGFNFCHHCDAPFDASENEKGPKLKKWTQRDVIKKIVFKSKPFYEDIE